MFPQPVYDNGTILISSAVVSLAGEVAGTVGTGATAVSSTWFPGASVPVTASLWLLDGCTFPVCAECYSVSDPVCRSVRRYCTGHDKRTYY